MKTVFRKLRKASVEQGKVRNFFAFSAGEIILIVIGIIIALQFSEWNQNRKNAKAETAILQRLKSDFEENQRRLKDQENKWQAMANNLAAFEQMIRPDPEPQPDEMVHRYMIDLYYTPAYTPLTAALSTIVHSGKIALLKNDQLNYQLNAWPAEMEVYQFSLNIITEFSYDYFDKFPKYHQLKDSMGDPSILNPKQEQLKGIVEDPLDMGNVGPSNFTYDQAALLSMPELESAVELKRVNANIMVLNIGRLLDLQQDILDLITTELGKRD